MGTHAYSAEFDSLSVAYLSDKSSAEYYANDLTMAFEVIRFNDEPAMLYLPASVVFEMHKRTVDAMELLLSVAISKEDSHEITQNHPIIS